MRYEAIEPISHVDAERATNAPPDTLVRIILAVALHDGDLIWAEAFCERFATHPEPRIRGTALLGFGYLARRFRRLDSSHVEPLVVAGLADPDPWVRGQSEAAADDIELFLGRQLRS